MKKQTDGVQYKAKALSSSSCNSFQPQKYNFSLFDFERTRSESLTNNHILDANPETPHTNNKNICSYFKKDLKKIVKVTQIPETFTHKLLQRLFEQKFGRVKKTFIEHQPKNFSAGFIIFESEKTARIALEIKLFSFYLDGNNDSVTLEITEFSNLRHNETEEMDSNTDSKQETEHLLSTSTCEESLEYYLKRILERNEHLKTFSKKQIQYLELFYFNINKSEDKQPLFARSCYNAIKKNHKSGNICIETAEERYWRIKGTRLLELLKLLDFDLSRLPFKEKGLGNVAKELEVFSRENFGLEMRY